MAINFWIVSHPCNPLALFKQELDMEYGRVVNLEFKSKEDLVSFRNKWTEWWPNNVPAVISRKSIRTSETSILLMATYETEEIADKAKQVVEKFFELAAEHIHDVFAFHGEVLDDAAGVIMK
tara:strand:- start:112 stop:477 length:366 start_codon:yes stop_codon:yes gene_type:complete